MAAALNYVLIRTVRSSVCVNLAIKWVAMDTTASVSIKQLLQLLVTQLSASVSRAADSFSENLLQYRYCNMAVYFQKAAVLTACTFESVFLMKSLVILLVLPVVC